MKRLLPSAALLLFAAAAGIAGCHEAAQPRPPHPTRAPQNDVAPDPRLADPYLRHVLRLADQKLGGRPTWGPEHGLARDYVRTQFETQGFARTASFEPRSGRQVFEQPFVVPVQRLGPGNFLRCKFLEDRSTTIYIGKLGRTFLPLNLSASKQVEGAILFVGFGIEDGLRGIDDYRDCVVEGKVVFALDGLPAALREAPAQALPAGALPIPDPRGEPAYKAALAQKHGAAAFVLLVKDPQPPAEGAGAPAPTNLESPAAAWDAYLPARQQARVDALEGRQTNFTELFAAVGMQSRQVRPEPPVEIPCAATLVSVGARVLGLPADELSGAIRAGDAVRPLSLPRAETLLNVAIDSAQNEGENVVAFLPGDDPALRDEAIVLGAHYDHLGRDATDHHFPGAIDNASGVAVLIESARSLAASFPKPRRSIFFVAFSGEEWGLWGARAFCKNPPIPCARIAAMINVDMAGFDDAHQVWAIGVGHNPALLERVNAANADNELRLQTNLEFAFKYGSDHWPFHEAGIPAVLLTTSRFPEYHTRKDLPDLASSAMMEKVAHAVTALVRDLASDERRLPAPLRFDLPYPHKTGK